MTLNEALKSGKPTVALFTATWCATCPSAKKALAEARMHDCNKVKLNVDDSMDDAQAYMVMSVPTAIMFDESGNPTGQLTGMITSGKLEELYERDYNQAGTLPDDEGEDGVPQAHKKAPQGQETQTP